MDNSRKEANIQIGKRLREARSNLGRTQAEIAISLGVSEEHYRKYESGATGLSADKLLVLYHEYGIDPTYLLTGEKRQSVGFYDIIKDCPKDKIFDMEQIVRYASNLYRRNDKDD